MVDSNEDEEDEADLMKVTPRMAKKPIEGLTHHVASLTVRRWSLKWPRAPKVKTPWLLLFVRGACEQNWHHP